MYNYNFGQHTKVTFKDSVIGIFNFFKQESSKNQILLGNITGEIWFALSPHNNNVAMYEPCLADIKQLIPANTKKRYSEHRKVARSRDTDIY